MKGWKLAFAFVATMMASTMGWLSPAQAGAVFTINLNPTTNAQVGLNISTIPVLPPFGLSGNLASDVSSFSITVGGYTFNLSNGTVLNLEILGGKVNGFDYTGKIGTGVNAIHLSIDYNFGSLGAPINSFRLNKGLLAVGGTTLASGAGSVTFSSVAVPEPSSLWMMLAGLLMVSYVLLRQRRLRLATA